MELITPEIGLFFWQTVTFVILMLLLGKFAWKPILSAINDREDSINLAIASADNARKEIKNLQADNDRILKEARIERDAILKDAREIREKMISDAKNEAQIQGQNLIAQAKVAIEAEKNAALVELKSHVSSLSLDIAEKLIKNNLSTTEAQIKLVDTLLADVKLN